MIYCILGKTACGKDSILKRLSNHPSLHKVVTMTSRPIRSGERDGIDYHFVTEEDFFKHEFIEYTSFNNWLYGTPKDSIDISKNHVIVVNPQGLLSFVDTYGWDNVAALVIHRGDRDRAIDYLSRDTNASVDELCRRFKADDIDFNVFNSLHNNHIHHIQNETGKFGECISQVEKIIGGYLK